MRAKLKQFRKEHGLTQSEIAEQIACNRKTYYMTELGKWNGSMSFWDKFQKAFEIKDSEMYGFIKDNKGVDE